MEIAPPATSRHMSRPLWLLPSGPDQVHGLSLREDQFTGPIAVFVFTNAQLIYPSIEPHLHSHVQANVSHFVPTLLLPPLFQL